MLFDEAHRMGGLDMAVEVVAARRLFTRAEYHRMAEVGILAPFAYFKAIVVDLDGLKIIGEETSHQAKALFPAVNVREALDPWNYLSANEKVAALKTLSDEGVEKIAARVLGRF